ncbi:hypothetical protein Trydic_g22220 [Trypoxylus dichotomus]
MLSVDEQIRYLLQWFNEWSELQRSDFLPIISEKYSNKPYVNGIVNNIANVSCQEKPMSLFQCRVKLFREWFGQWNMEQRDIFLKRLMEIDDVFSEKLKHELQNGTDNQEVLED